MHFSRREFLKSAGLSIPSVTIAGASVLRPASAQPGSSAKDTVTVLNPRMRAPLSFIIDDSTCLVNMGHFCMPQFSTVYPDRVDYQKPWKTWPREIPDSFVRMFGEWCAGQGVKGKYSIVPYPACVGWVDREMPGWSRRELLDSLKLVRELMVPNWDIHPEMITHTRVIDLKTGRPLEEISPATMENSYPREKKSVDELAAYLAYALRILKNCDLPCEGITTPGGFGNLVKSELGLAVHDAVRDVYGTDLPHYFKYVSLGSDSVYPTLEHVRDLNSDDPKVTVNVPACTGDWFGGWDGVVTPQPDKYATEDAASGRMIDVIERGDPAVMLCHWPGMYSNGTLDGFRAFQRVVTSLTTRFGTQTLWMKVSEIGRYYTARELTRISTTDRTLRFDAPFDTTRFTVRMNGRTTTTPQLTSFNADGTTEKLPLTSVTSPALLDSGCWIAEENSFVVCFDLPKGRTELSINRI